MSWKKYFRSVQTPGAAGSAPPVLPSSGDRVTTGTSSKFSSYLPEVYAGHPNRLQRYTQYDDMDRDSDINAALDTIADFCTQSEEQTDTPFEISYSRDANETEIKLIQASLEKWTRINKFRSRLWHMFRNVIKFGDQLFLRDPETNEWLWLDPFSVEMVKVDEDDGKEPDEYVIRGLDFIKQGKFGSTVADPTTYNTGYGPTSVGGRQGGGSGSSPFMLAGQNHDPRQRSMAGGQVDQSFVVDAKHVVHLSLSVGMDINWPFGQSVLEPIFKTFKQKELLEDAIIIYRVQRAPERRIFYIDVGSMPPVRAKAHIEQIKNEIHQRRIPNRTGGGSSVLDASYNPLSIMDDYFFAQTSEGRSSKVETLPGGDNVGEITDLSFFTKKLARGLRIPPQYLGIGEDQGGGTLYNDGKVGAAMIQEFRFTKYCMRIQAQLAPVCDKEFKRFLRQEGIEIDDTLFELRFFAPQNFAKYREMEIDSTRISIYSQIADNKHLSERYKLKYFLRMTEDEMVENEEWWMIENPNRVKKATGNTPADAMPQSDLSSVGVRSPDMGMDMGMPPGDEETPDDMPPDTGTDAAAGGGAGAPPPAAGGGPPAA